MGNPYTSGMAPMPTDYGMEQSQLMRRQKIADMLRHQALTQDGGSEVVNGWVVPKSPVEGMAKMAQALASNRMQQGVDERQMELARQLREQGAADIQSGIDAMQGTPGAPSPHPAPADELGGGPGMPPIPAIPGDRRKAMAILLQSQNPMAQALGAKLMESEMKPQEAFSLSPGQIRYSPDGKPIAIAVNHNQPFNPDGTPNQAYIDYDLERRAKGAPSVNVKNEVSMGKGLAGEVGPMMKDSTAIAEGAVKQVNAANSLLKALDSGKVIGGTGATMRLKGAQISQALGIGGKDEAEQIENTRAVIREFAQLTLQGRQQMKGQGAITESEGKLAEKAMSGEINDLTTAEMRQLAKAADRTARFNYAEHNRKMKVMQDNPDLRSMAPFYQGPAMPDEYAPAAQTPGNVRVVDW